MEQVQYIFDDYKEIMRPYKEYKSIMNSSVGDRENKQSLKKSKADFNALVKYYLRGMNK